MRRRHFFAAALTALAAFLLMPSALASHGRIGLWDITVTMGGNAPAMPDMSKLPPEALARMKAMGMSMNGNSITTQHCMTAQEVATDTPRLDDNTARSCTMSNLSHSGQSMSADMTCTGAFSGNGHMQFTYDSETHYSGLLTMTGTANGRPIQQEQKFDGHWISADCGGVAR